MCLVGGGKKKETKLGLAHSKAGNFGDWYSEVCVESEMISYYDVSGEPPPVLFTDLALCSGLAPGIHGLLTAPFPSPTLTQHCTV